MKPIVLASASILAMTAAAAHAQTAAPVQAPGSADNTPQGGAPSSVAAPAQGQAVLQEVIVTAEHKEQSAQKAPIAINVVQPAELTRENIVRAEDLTKAVPALLAANNGGANTTFFIRGVGNFTSNSYSDPAVAFNYDGVYIGRPSNTQGEFYDLQRVEVLKGPQGTLYGRNATGGAINVIPNRPVLDQFGGDIQVSYGNYNAVQVQGDVNIPIDDHNALRLAGTYDRHDGYLSDGTSDQDLYGGRAQLFTRVNADITNRIDADYSHQGGMGTGSYEYGSTVFNGVGYSFIPSGLGPHVGLEDPRSGAYLSTVFVQQAGRTAEPLGTTPYLDNPTFGITDEFNWKTPFGTLTVQPAYRESNNHSLFTTDNFRAGYTGEHDRQYSAEARLAGKVGPVEYIFGGYYFNESIKDDVVIDQEILTPYQNYATGTESKAAFGQLAYHVTPTVTLTAGGRFTDDLKTFDGAEQVFTLFCGNGGPPNMCPNTPLEPYFPTAAGLTNFYQSMGVPVSPVPLGIFGIVPPNTPSVLETAFPIDGQTRNDRFTYRLACDWQVTPRSLLYVSYETGFHGGGFSFARGIDSYKPETIGALTIGSKNRFFDNRLQLNVEAFRWKYHDQQFSEFGYDLGTPPALVFYTSNVGSSTIQGVDTDLAVQITPSTQLSGDVEYLDTRYDSFTVYDPNFGIPPNVNCPYAPVTYNGEAAFKVNCAGKPALNAPKWAFNINLSQAFQLGDYRLVAQGGPHYRSAFYDSPTYQPWLISKAAFQSDASVTLSPRADSWFVTAYINNIEDSRRIEVATTSSLNTVTAITTDPRTYGIRVGEHFR